MERNKLPLRTRLHTETQGSELQICVLVDGSQDLWYLQAYLAVQREATWKRSFACLHVQEGESNPALDARFNFDY